MPGRIDDMSSSSNTNGINGAGALVKNGVLTSHTDGKAMHQDASHRKATVGGAINGTSAPLANMASSQNGNGSGHARSPATIGIKDTIINDASKRSIPISEPADDLIHVTEGYVTLGSLIERVMQQSFVDFTNLVGNTAQLPVLLPNAAASTNGSSSSPNSTSYPAVIHQKHNAEKRILWIEWAKSNRDKFIKLLIIAQWARSNSQSIQTLIDLKRWSDLQDAGFYDAAVSIGQLKRDLFPFRLRNPDIRTALEVLSTGKDSRMPDLGMLPPKVLTPEKILRTLRNMNALLRVRLNTIEDLPFHLRAWTVHDGRATFTSVGEFEFDVTIADQDTSKQLYFVDLRLLFSPAPSIGDDRLRDMIQLRADEALSASGVSGCYDFLRNFVLTHKITMLQSQAVALSRKTWTGNLKIEMVHRWLIIQYWTNENYAKSWVEVGINSNSSTKLLPGHSPLPHIAARWRRFGKLVNAKELDLRLEKIDVEDLLRRTITSHIVEILQCAQHKLAEIAAPSDHFHMVLDESSDEPSACRLRLRLGKHSSESSLSIEPITGQLCLTPSSEIAARAQYELNRLKNPLDKAHATIETYLCFGRLSSIGKQAVASAWEPVRTLKLAADYLSKTLKTRVVQYAAFRPAWWADGAQDWMLIVIINLEGESWWAVELTSHETTSSLSDIHNMDFAHGPDYINSDAFSSIAQAGLRSLILGSTVRELKRLSIHVGIHWLPQAVPEYCRLATAAAPKEHQLLDIPTITILASELVTSISAMPKPHPSNFQLILGRYNPRTKKVAALIRGVLPWASRISDMISATFDTSVTFFGQGHFTLQLEAPLGVSLHSYMIERLNLLVRATSFLTSLKAHRIIPSSSTVSHVTFHYPTSKPATTADLVEPASSDTKLSCEVTFSADNRAAPTIKFLPAAHNPHHRIQESLAELLAKKSANNFLAVLDLTLPLLRALQRVELHGNLIRYWSVMKYRIVYRAASTVFEIVCKPTNGTADFHVYETRAGGNQANSTISRPHGYEDMMRDFFSKSSPGIRSLKSMLVCNAESIERAIDQLDNLVRAKIASSPLVVPDPGPQPALHPPGIPAAGNLQRPQFGAGRALSPNAMTHQQAQHRLNQQQRLLQQQQRMAKRPSGAGRGSNVAVIE